MTPAALEGETPAESRLQVPFGEHCDAGRRHTALAYILRTPQASGHWVALLPQESIGEEGDAGTCATRCTRRH